MRMAIVYAKSTLSTTNTGGVIFRLTVGEAWDSNDPFVQQHPNLFDGTPPRVRTSQGWVPPADVENATAVPGEKRNVKRG
jgi:hypothetical protein